MENLPSYQFALPKKEKSFSFWRYSLPVASSVVLLLLAWQFSSLFIILFMVMTALLLSLYRYVIPFHLGLDLTLFYAVILSIAISPVVGIFFAVFLHLVRGIMTQRICTFLFIKCGMYCILIIAASLLSPLGIIAVGIILSVARNILLTIITGFMNPARAMADVLGNVIHTFFSIWLFSHFGLMLLTLF